MRQLTLINQSRLRAQKYSVMSAKTLRIHHYEPLSQTNGPGIRFVIWLQGCTLRCPACYNPETHSESGGSLWTLNRLISAINPYKDTIDGFTISGGEPFQQARNLSAFIERLRNDFLKTIIVFSGYEWDELKSFPEMKSIKENIDVLIAGRYRNDLRVAKGLVGSENKTFHFFSNRLQLSDFNPIPSTEIFLDKNGNIRISGIDPLEW